MNRCKLTGALTMISVVCFLGSPTQGAGGLSCTNEPPCPLSTQITPMVGMSAGFGANASLSLIVDTANGDVRTSFGVGGAFPYAKPFPLWHNSRDSRTYSTGVGRNHLFNVVLLEHPDEWYPTAVRIVLANGYRVSFDQNLDGSFRGEPGIFSRLFKDSDGSYRLYSNGSPDMVDDGTVCYTFGPADATGKARLRSFADGANVTTISFVTSGNGIGEVSRVREDSTGREAVFSYNAGGRLESVTSLDGVQTTFTYNTTGDISQATSSWGTLTFGYDADHNITTVTDGNGGHSATMSYTGSARGVEFHDTNGQVQTYSYTTDSGNKVVSTAFGPSGTTPTVYEITPNGLVRSITAPGSQKVCYTYSTDKCYLGVCNCSSP